MSLKRAAIQNGFMVRPAGKDVSPGLAPMDGVFLIKKTQDIEKISLIEV